VHLQSKLEPLLAGHLAIAINLLLQCRGCIHDLLINPVFTDDYSTAYRLERDSVSRSNVDTRKPSRISTPSGVAKLLRVTDPRSGFALTGLCHSDWCSSRRKSAHLFRVPEI